MRILLAALTISACLALLWRLRAGGAGQCLTVCAASLAAAGLAPGLIPVCAYWHEAWAMVLMTLALAVWSPARWWPSFMIAMATMTIRELALSFLCVMGVVALLEGRRREAAAWAAGILVFAAMMAAQAHWLAAFVRSTDLHSPGWTGLGGWRAVLAMTHAFTTLAAVGLPIVALIVPLSLLGWAGWRSPTGLRGALLVGGYLCGFTIFGRPDNDYWALMIAPFLPLGLAFAPSALRDLVCAVRSRAATKFGVVATG